MSISPLSPSSSSSSPRSRLLLSHSRLSHAESLLESERDRTREVLEALKNENKKLKNKIQRNEEEKIAPSNSSSEEEFSSADRTPPLLSAANYYPINTNSFLPLSPAAFSAFSPFPRQSNLFPFSTPQATQTQSKTTAKQMQNPPSHASLPSAASFSLDYSEIDEYIETVAENMLKLNKKLNEDVHQGRQLLQQAKQREESLKAELEKRKTVQSQFEEAKISLKELREENLHLKFIISNLNNQLESFNEEHEKDQKLIETLQTTIETLKRKVNKLNASQSMMEATEVQARAIEDFLK
jgi:chromosome segregation ATPase